MLLTGLGWSGKGKQILRQELMHSVWQNCELTAKPSRRTSEPNGSRIVQVKVQMRTGSELTLT